MNLDTKKLRTITEPNKDIYRNKLAESAVKDNLYNKGHRDGFNLALNAVEKIIFDECTYETDVHGLRMSEKTSKLLKKIEGLRKEEE